MGIADIGTGIKTTILTTITTGLRVYATNEIPDSLELPCIIVMLGPGIYATTFTSTYDCSFRLILCVAKQDTPAAYSRLLEYVEPVGARSIFAALAADKTLGASCSTSKLYGYSGSGSTTWGRTVYLSAELELQVWS